jgi:hypothetical protein
MSQGEQNGQDLTKKYFEAMVKSPFYKTILEKLVPLVDTIRASTPAQQCLRISAPVLNDRFEKMARRVRLLRKEDSSQLPPENELLALRQAFLYLGFLKRH